MKIISNARRKKDIVTNDDCYIIFDMDAIFSKKMQFDKLFLVFQELVR